MKNMPIIRQLIREILLTEGYYDITRMNPQPTIENVISMWALGDKAYDPDEAYHAIYSPEEVWPYREYTWSAETARGTEVTGTDNVKYQDKWHFIPLDDEESIVGDLKWDYMYQELKTKGWNRNNPAYIEVGKNGIAKVGEGNHRLAIAMELGIPVPVLFGFKQTVYLSNASNVR